MIQSTLIDSHPNEYSQKFHYYPVAIKLDRCIETCNILNDLSNRACVLNKTEDLNLSMFNMVTWINESKHISFEWKCMFDEKNVIQINGGIMINVDVSVKRVIYVKKIIFGVLLYVVVKMENI